jgi:hypothetical protein
MVKKLTTKAEQRAEMELEMKRFLNRGGTVDNVAQGISGKNANDPPLYLTGRLFDQPRADRTFVPEVVAAIEARRVAKLKRKPERKSSRLPRARKKIIYDDFGEPLRKIWSDE